MVRNAELQWAAQKDGFRFRPAGDGNGGHRVREAMWRRTGGRASWCNSQITGVQCRGGGEKPAWLRRHLRPLRPEGLGTTGCTSHLRDVRYLSNVLPINKLGRHLGQGTASKGPDGYFVPGQMVQLFFWPGPKGTFLLWDRTTHDTAMHRRLRMSIVIALPRSGSHIGPTRFVDRRWRFYERAGKRTPLSGSSACGMGRPSSSRHPGPIIP